jgi:hypothetical protein
MKFQRGCSSVRAVVARPSNEYFIERGQPPGELENKKAQRFAPPGFFVFPKRPTEDSPQLEMY